MRSDEAPPPDERPAEAAKSFDPLRFVKENTRVLAPPLVPELSLHLAEESLPIWLKTEEELHKANIDPPYWAFAWAGGQALARYVLDHPELVANKRVLDLGAGSGLVAIAVGRGGASAVMASDVDPLALATISLNAALNGVTLETTGLDLLAAPPERYDVITVGDLFYEAPLARRVLAFIDEASATGAEILVGDPRRSYFPVDRFEKLAEYSVPVTRQLEDAETKKTAIWRLKPAEA